MINFSQESSYTIVFFAKHLHMMTLYSSKAISILYKKFYTNFQINQTHLNR